MKEEIEMEFEGWFSRLNCGNCQNVFDIDDDVNNGQEVTCDACGKTGVVSRR